MIVVFPLMYHPMRMWQLQELKKQQKHLKKLDRRRTIYESHLRNNSSKNYSHNTSIETKKISARHGDSNQGLAIFGKTEN